MKNNKKRRDRKNCKFYRPIGKVTAYRDYLGEGLQCYKVCNFFVDSSTESNVPLINKGNKYQTIDCK